jgi:hypothetical protein
VRPVPPPDADPAAGDPAGSEAASAAGDPDGSEAASGAGDLAGIEAVLRRAAWHGSPAAAVPVLAGLDPEGAVPARVRWLAGVCLGATGRYRQAARWLAPAGEPAGSLAASCLASHQRQLGRHAAAEPLDRLALATAEDTEARADALVGLVADAVGRHDLALARERLGTATRWVNLGDTGWRACVRLAWVTAETALLGSNPDAAVAAGRHADEISRHAEACRHAVKSWLVLGVALDAAGRCRPAARVLRRAAAGAARLDLIPLVDPARTVLSGIMRTHAPGVAERERQQARSAQSIMEDPATGRSCG